MDAQTLAALEEAIEPYRRIGFVITSQTEGAITLTYPPEEFSYLLFIFTLLVFWPLAVIYLVSHNNQKVKRVCVRITSQGTVEESGYTITVMLRESRRRRLVNRLIIVGLVVLVLLVLLFLAYRYL